MLSSKQARSQGLYTEKAKLLNKVYTLEVDSLLVLSHPSFEYGHIVGFDKLDRMMLFKMALEYERMKQDNSNLTEERAFFLEEINKKDDRIQALDEYVSTLETKVDTYKRKDEDVEDLLQLKNENIEILEKRLSNCKMSAFFKTARDITIGAVIGVAGYSIYTGATQ